MSTLLNDDLSTAIGQERRARMIGQLENAFGRGISDVYRRLVDSGTGHDAAVAEAIQAWNARKVAPRDHGDLLDAAQALIEGKMPSGSWRGATAYDLAAELHRRNDRSPSTFESEHQAMTWRSSPGAKQIINASSGQTSDDFPNLLGSALVRSFTQRASASDATMLRVAAERKSQTVGTSFDIRAVPPSSLQPFGEAGEIAGGVVLPQVEQVNTQGVGRIWQLSRPSLVNDMLGSFQDISAGMADALTASRADKVFDVLWGTDGTGRTMADNLPIFCSDHSNLATSGGDVTVDKIALGMAALADQRDIAGPIDTREGTAMRVGRPPRFLVCGGAQLGNALLACATLAQASFVLEPLLETRITDDSWFLVVDPEKVVGLTWGALESTPSIVMDSQMFQYDAIRFRLTDYAGAGCANYRPLYRFPST